MYGLLSIEPVNKVIVVGIRISFERNMMLVAEQFLKGLIKKYGKLHLLSTDGGTWYLTSSL